MRKRPGISKTAVVVGVALAAAMVCAAVILLRMDTTGTKGSGLGPEFDYDLERYRVTDPELILYERTGRMPTGFDQVYGIAVGQDDRIYVAGDQAVRSFDREGNPLSEVKLPARPRALAVAQDGALYVCTTARVRAYDTEGAETAAWEPLGDSAVLTCVAVYRDNVFLADAGNRVVLRYDRAGRLIRRIGERNDQRNIPGFTIPSPYFDLAISPDGLLRVVNPGRLRVEAYTFDGDLELSWGQASTGIEGFCGCCNPAHIAILPDGSFVTSEKGLTRVKVYDPDGVFQGVVAGPEVFAKPGQKRLVGAAPDSASKGLDVAADSAGRVLVLEESAREVWIFTRSKGR